MILSDIELLLHYFYSPEDHPAIVASEKWASSGLIRLGGLGLVQSREAPCAEGSGYEVTERGRVYVEAIRALPLPVQQWVIPTSEPRE